MQNVADVTYILLSNILHITSQEPSIRFQPPDILYSLVKKC